MKKREYRFPGKAFPAWERQRGGGFAAPKGSQPRLAALGSPFQGKGLAWTLPPSYGRRCPEGAEVGWGKRYEKERRRSFQVRRLREHPIHRYAVPLPQWGRLRYENVAIPASSKRIHACVEKQYPRQSLPRVGKVANKASRIGFCRYEREGRSSQVCHYTRAPERRPKRKPIPPRCARQPLPREGARVDTPSFLWKEVPRRGGGWMGEAE